MQYMAFCPECGAQVSEVQRSGSNVWICNSCNTYVVPQFERKVITLQETIMDLTEQGCQVIHQAESRRGHLVMYHDPGRGDYAICGFGHSFSIGGHTVGKSPSDKEWDEHKKVYLYG